jgi:hypothetical protein
MKNYDELLAMLAQGASISRERNMNLDFAKVADEAATAVQELQAENTRLTLHIKHIGNDALRAENHELQVERDAAAAHKVERDGLALRVDELGNSNHAFRIVNKSLGDELDTLRAKLSALEGQEPVAWCEKDGMHYRHDLLINEGLKLYLAAPQAQWQPIETAPKDETDIIVMYIHIDTQIVHTAFWLELSGWWSHDKSEVDRMMLCDCMTPTHWMPLPPAPQGDQQ